MISSVISRRPVSGGDIVEALHDRVVSFTNFKPEQEQKPLVFTLSDVDGKVE